MLALFIKIMGKKTIIKQYKQLKEFFKKRNWNIDDKEMCFEADNLLIYYREDRGEWRLKNTLHTGSYSTMDITTVYFPFDEKEQKRIRSLCSKSHLFHPKN